MIGTDAKTFSVNWDTHLLKPVVTYFFLKDQEECRLSTADDGVLYVNICLDPLKRWPPVSKLAKFLGNTWNTKIFSSWCVDSRLMYFTQM